MYSSAAAKASQLSSTELDALELLGRKHGILISELGDRNERDLFGQTEAGMTVYRKLIKKDLAFVTEEDLIDEDDPSMGTWTPTMELTSAGQALYEAIYRAPAEDPSPVTPKKTARPTR